MGYISGAENETNVHSCSSVLFKTRKQISLAQGFEVVVKGPHLRFIVSPAFDFICARLKASCP